MFVLPPVAWSHGASFRLTFSLPPRYPNGNLYTGMPGGGLLETNNTLEHPTGPDYQLVVGEGTYLLRDDLHLATPPPHPSDAPQPNNNPLATTIGPPTAGTKLSLAVIAPRRSPARNLYRPATAQSGRSGMPPSIQEESAKSDSGSTANGYGSASNRSIHSSAFGDGNPALQAAPVKGKKGDQRVKPKNNIVKSNSSFVSRVIPHESLQKRLNERSPEGMLAFANVNRALMWLDLSSENQKTENMTKVLFTKAHALCHDIHEYTKSQTHMDVVIGFNSGDIIWYECMSQKYARLNKNGIINATAVSQILWVPNKENFFLAAHMDGSIIAYDKDKEDADFVSEEDMTNGHVDGAVKPGIKFSIRKSIQSRNQKSNPIAWWKVSNMKVNNMAFSPDGLLLAIVCDDGTLTIMDYIHERVLDVFRSYYGAILCVTWSPDGRYVLTGGQDDLVSIWSIGDSALVARCVGHESWITDVKFDPWRCDERNYRFGSVGEDCRLLLWDFSVGMLGRPKAMSARNRGTSVSSSVPLDRKISNMSATGVSRLRSNSSMTTQPDGVSAADGVEQEAGPSVHPVDPRSSTAVLPPVMNKQVDKHPLSWVGFEERCIITSCKDGHIREWDRPKEGGSNDTS
ncbi:hypothetical protein D0863_01026 [Hortaea werneckii]|uniref:Anaphase-promoting complex subunit 4-like WD40 domain-containing protein n=1 Tax=Hortaea werneckii TaxID=91943 RepID=A0A3M7EMT3_HORWE|nr:hypothetical protein D0863_01026 [Hortaea werneckii]